MDIKKLLEEKKPLIDKEIEKIIPRKISKEWLELALGKADYAYDAETLTNEVSKPVWDFLDRGGKRWRPVLLLWACEAVGGSEEKALHFTPIPELIHSGTIVLDDVQDFADVRRGKPALHKVYGIDTATNDGNALYFLPLVLLYRNLQKLEQEKLIASYNLVCEELLRVSLGQAMDINWHKGGKEPNEKEYLQMCVYKTGVLARLAAKLGAIIGDGSKEQVYALGKFGEGLGVGFQIQDDILNLTAEGGWGKEIGEDITEGKRTLLVIHALEKVGEKEGNRLREILNKHTKDKKEIEEAIEIIKKSEAIEYAREKANGIVEESWGKVSELLPESEAKGELKALADFCISRKI